MSGHAAIALVLLRDRGQFATLTIYRLGEPIPPSQGESPFPVDFYLSWMSTKLPVADAIRVELEAMAYRDGLKNK
jgi:hypothetical protein